MVILLSIPPLTFSLVQHLNAPSLRCDVQPPLLFLLIVLVLSSLMCSLLSVCTFDDLARFCVVF